MGQVRERAEAQRRGERGGGRWEGAETTRQTRSRPPRRPAPLQSIPATLVGRAGRPPCLPGRRRGPDRRIEQQAGCRPFFFFARSLFFAAAAARGRPAHPLLFSSLPSFFPPGRRRRSPGGTARRPGSCPRRRLAGDLLQRGATQAAARWRPPALLRLPAPGLLQGQGAGRPGSRHARSPGPGHALRARHLALRRPRGVALRGLPARPGRRRPEGSRRGRPVPAPAPTPGPPAQRGRPGRRRVVGLLGRGLGVQLVRLGVDAAGPGARHEGAGWRRPAAAAAAAAARGGPAAVGPMMGGGRALAARHSLHARPSPARQAIHTHG